MAEHELELVDLYALDMRRRGLSPKTIRIVTAAVKGFGMWHDFATASQEDVESFIDARNVSNRTRYWWLSTLHGFFDWGVRNRKLFRDPTVDIRRPRPRRTLPRPIPADELARALEQASGQMKCWLLLGALAGLRCQEIAGLSRDDIFPEDMLLRVVYGKGGKERIVPMHPFILRALEALPMPSRGLLFRRPDGSRYSADRVSHLICTFLHDTGSDSGAHALRHWFCTETLETSGGNIRVTQELAGHESPATTAIYTQIRPQRTRDAVNALKLPEPEDRNRGSVRVGATVILAAVLMICVMRLPGTPRVHMPGRRRAVPVLTAPVQGSAHFDACTQRPDADDCGQPATVDDD